MKTLFVLVFIVETFLSYESRTWRGYYPMQMIAGLTQEECEGLARRSREWSQEFPSSETPAGSQTGHQSIVANIECWPE